MSQLTNQTRPEPTQTQDSEIAEHRTELERLKSFQYASGPYPKRARGTPFWVRLTLYPLTLWALPMIGIWLMVRDKEYKWKHFFLTHLTVALGLLGVGVIGWFVTLVPSGIDRLNITPVSQRGQNNSVPAPTPAPTSPVNLNEYVNIPDGYGYGIVQATAAVFGSPSGSDRLGTLTTDSVVTWQAMKVDCQWFRASDLGNSLDAWIFQAFQAQSKELWIHVRDIEAFYPTRESAQKVLDGRAIRFKIPAADRAKTNC